MRILLVLGMIICGNVLQAQVTFHSTIKVEFEKTVYVRQLYKTNDLQWYEMIKDRLPETAITYYEFLGDTSKSVFRPGRQTGYDARYFYQGIADKNIVYNDYRKNLTIAQKPVFEEVFLVEDSLPQIKWKLTADTRNIAGFECRKAIGILNDSIALFAFYAEELLVSGGPESVQGLPGMVLGLGVPRLHTTWFATKVEVNGVNLSAVTPATKGKKVNRQTMIKSIDDVLKNWGDYGRKLIWNFVI